MKEGPQHVREAIQPLGPGPTAQGLALLDPKALLAEAIARMASPLKARTVLAAMFLPLYCGEFGQQMVDRAMTYKAQQSIGGMRHLAAALRSLSVEEVIKPQLFNQGGSK